MARQAGFHANPAVTAIAKPQSYRYRIPQEGEWQLQENSRSLVYSKPQERANDTARLKILDN